MIWQSARQGKNTIVSCFYGEKITAWSIDILLFNPNGYFIVLCWNYWVLHGSDFIPLKHLAKFFSEWLIFIGQVFRKNLTFKIAMCPGVRAGIGLRASRIWPSPRLTFWLIFFQSYILPLVFSGLLSYLVGMKRRTSRCFTCKRDNSHFLCYLKNLSIMLFVSKLPKWFRSAKQNGHQS